MLAMLVVAVGVTGCGGNKTIVVPPMPAAPAAPVAAAPTVPTTSAVAAVPTSSTIVTSSSVATGPTTLPPPVQVVKIIKIVKVIHHPGPGQPVPGDGLPRQDGSVKIIKIVKVIHQGPDWKPVSRPWPCRHHGWRRHHPHGPCHCPANAADPAVASAAGSSVTSGTAVAAAEPVVKTI